MKNTKGFAPITLILILIGALFIGGGIYYWQKQKNAVQSPSVSTPQISAVNQPATSTQSAAENIIKPQQSTATSSVFTVGSDGGTIIFPDGKAQITFPKGALTRTVTVGTAIHEDVGGEQIGPLYEIYVPNLSDLEFLKLITIKVSYDPKLLPDWANENKGNIKLAMAGPLASWDPIQDSSIDVVNHTITATAVSIYSWTETKGVPGGVFDSPGIITEFGVLPYGN